LNSYSLYVCQSIVTTALLASSAMVGTWNGKMLSFSSL
jgi:hypothetical protein